MWTPTAAVALFAFIITMCIRYYINVFYSSMANQLCVDMCVSRLLFVSMRDTCSLWLILTFGSSLVTSFRYSTYFDDTSNLLLHHPLLRTRRRRRRRCPAALYIAILRRATNRTEQITKNAKCTCNAGNQRNDNRNPRVASARHSRLRLSSCSHHID